MQLPISGWMGVNCLEVTSDGQTMILARRGKSQGINTRITTTQLPVGSPALVIPALLTKMSFCHFERISSGSRHERGEY